MDGVHDMGGMDGFGKVAPEPNGPVFHERWEGRVLAISRAIRALGAWNIDWDRYGIELLLPQVYLTSSYYKRWFLRSVNLLVQRGFIEADEMAAGHALRPGKVPDRGKFNLADVARVMRRGSFGRPAPAPARFKVGDRVRAKNIHPKTHTRLPAMRAASGDCRAHDGATSFRTPLSPAKARILSGSIPCASTPKNFGERMRIRQ
jgi:nitrile hydratase